MTLTQTAILVKQAITISIVTLILGITSFIGYKIWYAYYLAHLPPVEEKPDLKFGVLPAIDFPASTVSSSNFSYSLDNTTGNLPKVGIDPGFEKLIKVYFVNQTVATLLSGERAQVLAEKFNITASPQIQSDTQYKFQDQDKNLSIDLNTGNFSYTKEATISGQPIIDEDNKLITDFKQTLSKLEVLKTDLSQGRAKVVRLKPDTAQISLWPASIDQRNIFTGDLNKSWVTATIIDKADDLDNYSSLDFTYYPIDIATFATYPTKTGEAAFEDLKNGKGVIVAAPDKPQISITSIYLGYYLPKNYSPYLQPIFIFEGPSFVAYVSAINSQFQSEAK